MKQNRLYLKIPNEHQLEYRIKLLADVDTMDYNKGFGDNGSGCYHLTYKQAQNWYKNWSGDPQKYYAYLARNEDDVSIGEVNIHYDDDYSLYMTGIIIEACNRGNGYAEEGLQLLAEKAFYELGLDKIADSFPADRIAAGKAFEKVGFVRISDDLLILTKENYEKMST